MKRGVKVAALSTLALTAALSTAQAHAKAPIPRFRKPVPQAAAPAVQQVVSLELASLPTGELPPPIELPRDSSKPLVIPQDAVAPDDIEVTSLDPSLPMAVLRKRAGAATSVQLKVKTPGAAAFLPQYAGQPTYGAGQSYPMTLTCGPAYQGYGPTPLRWERFRVEEGGQATLEIADAYFSLGDCSLKVSHRATFHPSVVANVGGAAVAYAMKSDSAITLFFPREAQLAADTSTLEPELGQGAVWHVTMPIRKGVSSSVEAELQAGALTRTLTEVMGKAPTLDPVAQLSLRVGVDAVQTVSDDAPTVIAHVRSL